jgi:hypothetical protein
MHVIYWNIGVQTYFPIIFLHEDNFTLSKLNKTSNSTICASKHDELVCLLDIPFFDTNEIIS